MSWSKAIVVGSGMAGLMAARVLSEHFDKVVVVERDARSHAALPRKGAPQGHHLHALLERGQGVLRGLFPGLIEDLVTRGAVLSANAGSALKAFVLGVWAADCDTGFGSLQVSRPLLENAIRARVEALGNVAFLYGCNFVDVLIPEPEGAVAGIRFDSADGRETLSANLVIDATGRAAAVAGAVADRGWPKPEDEIVVLDFGYASSVVEIAGLCEANFTALLTVADPPDSRGALFQSIEGGRWLLSCAGRGGQKPDASEAGLRAFVRALPSPVLDDIVSRSAMGEVVAYRFGSSVRRRFDRLDRAPEGFVAVGDAICSLNPVYGQGMSVAAVEAESLGARLANRAGGSLDGLWRDVYQDAAAALSTPWEQCLTLDMLYDTTRIVRPPVYPLLRRLIGWSQYLGQRDPRLRATFVRLANLSAGPDETISVQALLAAQLRVWRRLGRAGAAPLYAFASDAAPVPRRSSPASLKAARAQRRNHRSPSSP